MKRIKVKKKFSFFTLAVLLLSLVLVSRAASCIEDLRYGFFYSTSYSAQDYQYALQYKEYPYLNRICRRDTSSSSDPFIQACHGISDYYEATILYHAYDKAKNNAAAQTELQRMKACEAYIPTMKNTSGILTSFLLLTDSHSPVSHRDWRFLFLPLQ